MDTGCVAPDEIVRLRDEVAYLQKCWDGMADHVLWQTRVTDNNALPSSITSFRDPLLPLELVFTELRTTSVAVRFARTNILNIVIVIVGSCTIFVRNELIGISAGEIFAVSPDEEVAVRLADGCEQALLLRVRFLPDVVPACGGSPKDSDFARPFYMSVSNRGRYLGKNSSETQQIIRQIWSIYDNLQTNDKMYRLRVHTSLLNVLMFLAEYHRKHDNRIKNLGPGKLDRLRRVFEYLDENYNRRVSLSNVASIAMMSDNYFCKFFKSATGSSFVQYLLRIRIDKAKELLLHTSLPITDISSEVGFTNYNYFDRVFRRQTNLSPFRYRAENRRSNSLRPNYRKHVLAVSMSALDNVGWAAIHMGMMATSNEPEGELFTLSAGNSIDEQLTQVGDFIDDQAKVIILNPVNSSKATNAVIAANRAGIPVVCVDRSIEGGDVATLVESDNIACGRSAARLMATVAPGRRLRALVLQGDLSTSAGVERNQGFLSAIEEQNDISIQMTLPCYWDATFAREAVLYSFVRYPEINAIFLPSDNAYINAVVASLQTLDRFYPYGHSSHVVIVTVDGSPAVLDQVRNAYVDGVVTQDLYGMGVIAMSEAVRIAANRPVQHPIVRIPPITVTKEDVDSAPVWGNLIYRIRTNREMAPIPILKAGS